ncbi:hypothetical protein VTN77DRAFT_4349 [Rasamsonia byssochlamydoides]|uniref:uncharacterized protein n=1 Tax=Rasamsonia byssochlamydoides TaxID=89139 RepID=UPI003743E2A5
MAPKRQAAASTAVSSSASSGTSTPVTTTSSSNSNSNTTAPVTLSPNSPPGVIIKHIWQRYLSQTPQRTFLLDAFMAFLVVVGVIQFVYCVVAGNYPFNAFLSGFSAAVGQFVLTASLRMQTSQSPPSTSSGSKSLSSSSKGKASTAASTEQSNEDISPSHERAFADYIFGSLILHFFCINFIN